MGVRDGLVRLAGVGVEERSTSSLSWSGYQQLVSQVMRYGGHQYLLANQSYGPNEPPVLLTGNSAYTTNGVAFAVERRRIELFRQASFKWKRYGVGPKPMAADLLTTSGLAPLDNPGKLLEWMLLDADLAGNAFAVLHEGRLRRLNPQWCTIVSGSQLEPDDPDVAWDAEPIGLIYRPPMKPAAAESWLWSEVAHFAPIQDPDARWRGMSWMSPVLAEVSNTNAYNTYVSKYWENNATPNNVVTFNPDVDLETVAEFKDLFLEKHEGVERAFRTAFLGGGADIKMVGANLKDLAAKEITADQFAKICAAGGVPPIVVTIVPGLESASTYANYASAHRAFADLTMRPLWLEAVRSLAKLVRAPQGFELWYDVSDVSALQADALDDAQVQQAQFTTMEIGVRTGFDPDTVAQAVTTGDTSKVIGNHTGKVSVQLQEPGAGSVSAGGQQ